MSVEEVRAKLRQAQQRAEHFRKLASNPTLSLRAALAAHHRLRSNKAAVKLYRKALVYEIEKAKAVHRPPPYTVSPPLAPRSFD
jgi:hypothetical protein